MSPTAAEALLTRIGRVDHLLRNGRDIGAVQAIELLGEVRAFIEGAGADSAAENEACAVLVETFPHWLGATGRKDIASAIRARSTTPAREG